MSQGDIETLRAEYESMTRGHFFSNVHPDFELKPPDPGIVPQTYRGPEEARRAFEDFFAPFDHAVVEPQEFFERGDRIVAFFVQRARPRGSTAMVEIRAGHL
jgi:ketosteroid isomerase-like protein